MSRRARLTGLALFFIACAVYGSFVPLRWRPIAWMDGLHRFARMPVEPGLPLFNGDFFTNVLVFLPIGFFAAGAACGPKGPRYERWNDRPFAITAAVLMGSAALSTLIELGQVYVRDRTPSLSDVVAQSLGGFAGAVLWALAGIAAINGLARALRASSREGRILRLLGVHATRTRWMPVVALTGWLALVVLHYWAPFDFGVSAHALDQRIAILYTRAPFHRYYWLPSLVALGEVMTLLMLALGTSVLLSFVRPSERHMLSARTTVLLTTVIFTLVEWGQLYLPARRADPTDVVIAVVGAFTGAVVAQALAGSPPPMNGAARS